MNAIWFALVAINMVAGTLRMASDKYDKHQQWVAALLVGLAIDAWVIYVAARFVWSGA